MGQYRDPGPGDRPQRKWPWKAHLDRLFSRYGDLSYDAESADKVDFEMVERTRLAAFDSLKEQCLLYGATLPRTLLSQGSSYQGERVTLIAASGIWNPRQFEAVRISITIAAHGL